jgi:hypothetical protein
MISTLPWWLLRVLVVLLAVVIDVEKIASLVVPVAVIHVVLGVLPVAVLLVVASTVAAIIAFESVQNSCRPTDSISSAVINVTAQFRGTVDASSSTVIHVPVDVQMLLPEVDLIDVLLIVIVQSFQMDVLVQLVVNVTVMPAEMHVPVPMPVEIPVQVAVVVDSMPVELGVGLGMPVNALLVVRMPVESVVVLQRRVHFLQECLPVVALWTVHSVQLMPMVRLSSTIAV